MVSLINTLRILIQFYKWMPSILKYCFCSLRFVWLFWFLAQIQHCTTYVIERVLRKSSYFPFIFCPCVWQDSRTYKKEEWFFPLLRLSMSDVVRWMKQRRSVMRASGNMRGRPSTSRTPRTGSSNCRRNWSVQLQNQSEILLHLLSTRLV